MNACAETALDSLRTVSDSDIIFVFKDGYVVEQGSHHALIEKGGVYADMWAQQED